MYLLSTRVDLSSEVHRFEMFSSNPGKVHFEFLINLLRCIRDNKTLVLKHYSDMNYVPSSDLLKQVVLRLRIN